MASVFKQQYTIKGENGKRIKKKSAHWYFEYKGPDGTFKREKGFTDKAATVQLAAMREKEAELERRGMGDRFKAHRQTPLSQHLEDFKESLGETKHAKHTHSTVKALFEACEFVFWK